MGNVNRGYEREWAASCLLPDPGGEVVRGFIRKLVDAEKRVAELEAQLGMVKEWQSQGSNGHFNFDTVCPTERLKDILSLAPEVLAVTSKYYLTRLGDIVRYNRPLYGGPAYTPVTAIIISREEAK